MAAFHGMHFVRHTVGETVVFLWCVLTLGFSLLIMAGFFLPQM